MEKTEFGIEKVEYKTFDGQEVVLTEKNARDICGANQQYLTRNEIEMFMKTAKYRKLNPFLRELYLLKPCYKKDGKDNPQAAQIIVSKQAVMSIAEENPNYDGFEHGIIVKRKEGAIEDRVGCIKFEGETLLGGWSKVYRKDRRVPFIARLDIKEYTKARDNGKGTWDTMASTMIDKCAIVSAMRLAFPQQLGGLYTDEEFKNSNFDPTKEEAQNPIASDNKPTQNENAETDSATSSIVYDIPSESYDFETVAMEENKEATDAAVKPEIKPVRYEHYNGKDYPVYPFNPEYKHWYGDKERFENNSDKFNIVDMEAPEGRFPVQEKELKTKAEPKGGNK